MLNTFTLKNGLKVATYAIPQMRSVFLDISVIGGSMFDTPKKCGVAHFMEHILVQAIPSFPSIEEFSDYIESMSGSYNASTYPQSIDFNTNLPESNLENILKIAAEVFFEPLFNEVDIGRERGAIIEEIKQRQDQVWYKNNRFWASVRYKKGHPLLLDGGGLPETITKLQKKDLVDFWLNYFFPNNTYLVLVGKLKSETQDLIKNYFSKYIPKKIPSFPSFTNKDMSDFKVAQREDPDLKTCYIDLTFPSVSGEQPLQDRITQFVISYIFGDLRRSRLYRLLRQQRGLVYAVGCSISSYQKFGYVNIYSQAASENAEEVIRLITRELKAFIDHGPTNEELKFAKNYYINRIMMSFDHPSTIASWIEGSLMWEDKVYLPEEWCEFIKKVDKGKIMDFMKKHWELGKINLTVQGPIKLNNKKLESLVAVLR